MNAVDSRPAAAAPLPGSSAAAGPPASLAAETLFAEETAADKELGQAEFLKLMLTQIEQQDPFEPTSNGDFIAQMAQFSTVEGIGDMKSSIENLSSSFGAQQTLQASSLVGRDVLVAGDEIGLRDGAAQGRYALERSATSTTLLVHDAGGALIAQRELGSQRAGRHEFTWDGRDDDGDAMPEGTYRVSVIADDGADGAGRAAETLVMRSVEAVEFGAGGQVLMHTDGGEALTLDELREIRQTTTHDDTSGE